MTHRNGTPPLLKTFQIERPFKIELVLYSIQMYRFLHRSERVYYLNTCQKLDSYVCAGSVFSSYENRARRYLVRSRRICEYGYPHMWFGRLKIYFHPARLYFNLTGDINLRKHIHLNGMHVILRMQHKITFIINFAQITRFFLHIDLVSVLKKFKYSK